MFEYHTCAGCNESVDESRAFIESDHKGNLRYFHTQDECFTKWHNKQQEPDNCTCAQGED